MDAALADGQPNPAFTPARDETRVGRASSVPSVVGLSQEAAVDALRSAGFEAAIGGSTTSDLPAGVIASQSRIGSATPGSTITLHPSRGPAGGGGGAGAGEPGGDQAGAPGDDGVQPGDGAPDSEG